MEYQDMNYDNIIEILTDTFGNVLSRDCMFTIVESCEGNLEASANAILNIMMDGNLPPTIITESTGNILKENVAINDNTKQQNIPSCNVTDGPEPNIPSTSSAARVPIKKQNVKSYAGASKKTIQPSQKSPKPKTTTVPKFQNVWTDQLKHILLYHENGARVLVIMRGLPGSGKSYLAKKIIDAMFPIQNHQNYNNHIFSTDDYFMRNNRYVFDSSKLSEFHEQNFKKAKNGMMQGISPIIIDNTNVEFWEMQPYINIGVQNGYIIEVVEPNTPWARNAKQLQRNTVHDVSLHSIQRKLEIYQPGITGAYLISYFRIQYPPNMTPPVLRLLPPFVQALPNTTKQSFDNDRHIENDVKNEIKLELATNEPVQGLHDQDVAKDNSFLNVKEKNLNENPVHESGEKNYNKEEDMNITQIKKSLEEIEKIEDEWENGSDWEDDRKIVKKDKSIDFASSRPQRKELPRSSATQKLLPSDEECQDWSKISMFLPSWGESSQLPAQVKPSIEKRSSSTCIEMGDTVISNLKNPFKIITAIPRDINEFHVESKSNKIPEKWMLDKSTSTSNNEILTDTQRCKNEEQHFNSFRKLFKNISRAVLRDIFDKCHGDVNWAVDIVLDGMNNQQLGLIEGDDVSDTEEEVQNAHLCKCLSAYDILPHHNESSLPSTESEQLSDNATLPVTNTKKVKKEYVVSEESMQLKRQIEQNVVISDNHYSEHCLKIRKLRYGVSNDTPNIDADATETADNAKEPLESNDGPSTSECSSPSPNDDNIVCVYEEDNSETIDDDFIDLPSIEPTLNIKVGFEFIHQLDELFGRSDMKYSSSIQPIIKIPLSLLDEINALWIESWMRQLENDEKQTALMIEQDAQFARELAIKENELVQEGKQPEVPDFKEIMDMDLAFLLYHKDVDEGWREKLPHDLAAKLTREKLYNLFPEIIPDTLSELLVAHNNNFQVTVESLLVSTGRNDVLKEKNGVSKFVMQKELERQEKVLQKEKEAMSEVEWPLLPSFEKVDMDTVQKYRNEAEKHLQSRNMNYQKAQDYIRRGMTQVASYYSDIASYHTMKYEHSNSLAAASLMQLHATKCPNNATLDLHYLRVCEAKESLDLFIDTHIQKLREMRDKNIVRCHTLFFITGRGLHSQGKPRVKPAIIHRLTERGLTYYERNPGLLSTKVCADDKLSYQIA